MDCVLSVTSIRKVHTCQHVLLAEAVYLGNCIYTNNWPVTLASLNTNINQPVPILLQEDCFNLLAPLHQLIKFKVCQDVTVVAHKCFNKNISAI